MKTLSEGQPVPEELTTMLQKVSSTPLAREVMSKWQRFLNGQGKQAGAYRIWRNDRQFKDEVINQLKKKHNADNSIKQKEKKPLFAGLSLGGGVSDKDIVIFTRQFATMIDAGLPLVQALDILSTQVENKFLAKTLVTIKEDVESGSTYADALKKHPKAFSELYANMVAAGESGGILDTILNRLAAYIEKAMKLKKKVKGAMVYPIVVSSIAVLCIAIIMRFVVPTFSRMFTQMGGTLPCLLYLS
jgi:type IV pilus assembly protein PilC